MGVLGVVACEFTVFLLVKGKSSNSASICFPFQRQECKQQSTAKRRFLLVAKSDYGTSWREANEHAATTATFCGFMPSRRNVAEERKKKDNSILVVLSV